MKKSIFSQGSGGFALLDAFGALRFWSALSGFGALGVRRLCVLVVCAVCCTATVFAADKAQFADMGFSPDGAFYLFAQYGEVAKSKELQNGYAEVYTVDCAKNEFVPLGTFKVGPSYKTAGKSGEQVFNDIITEKDKVISKYGIPSESNATVLYLANPVTGAEAEKSGDAALGAGSDLSAGASGANRDENTVTFRDFAPRFDGDGETLPGGVLQQSGAADSDSGGDTDYNADSDSDATAHANAFRTYTVRLTELVEGKNESVLSCFYLLLELKDETGTLIKRIIVGNPQTKRKGVSGYRLNRVLKDKSGTSLVFVIEKHLAEPSGTSVRYMVETVTLHD